MLGSIYADNYRRLKELGILDAMSAEHSTHFKAPGFMDLVIEAIGEYTRDGKAYPLLSIAHYYEQNGDLCPDPEMEILLNHEFGYCEAMTMSATYGYFEVYPGENLVNLRNKKELNAFLGQWLKNIKDQGHKKVD